MSYTTYQRFFMAFSSVTFLVILVSNAQAAIVFAAGIVLGLLIAITYGEAVRAGEVKRD